MPSHAKYYGTIKCDQNGHIDRTLSCSRCQYELRGCDPAGTCPECGESILESVNNRAPESRAWYLRYFWTAVIYAIFFVFITSTSHSNGIFIFIAMLIVGTPITIHKIARYHRSKQFDDLYHAVLIMMPVGFTWMCAIVALLSEFT